MEGLFRVSFDDFSKQGKLFHAISGDVDTRFVAKVANVLLVLRRVLLLFRFGLTVVHV